MSHDLAYVLLTPHSLRKARTGGILSRLLSRTGLELVYARMLAPDADFASRYAATMIEHPDHRHRATHELLRDYVLREFTPAGDSEQGNPRALLLVFAGEGAPARLMAAVGHILFDTTRGETIRDTYGDYMVEPNGDVRYFEPAVLAAPDEASARRDLQLFAEWAGHHGALAREAAPSPQDPFAEETLVLVKPDNFRFPNGRPGAVVDLFSRTGLTIVGMKVIQMSVAQAEAFYGPVLETLQRVMHDSTGTRARMAVEKELGCPIEPDTETALADLLGPIYSRYYWETLVQFMAGSRPSEVHEAQKSAPGTETSLAVVYRGRDAVRKIREVLGPTDPAKAPLGSIRREFGQTIMINAAHASDAADNATREMGIIEIEENSLQELVEMHGGSL